MSHEFRNRLRYSVAACLVVVGMLGGAVVVPAEDGLKDFAFAYHGMLVDNDFREIEITPKVLESTQRHYLATLLENSPKKVQEEAALIQKAVAQVDELRPSDRAYVRYALVEALLAQWKDEKDEKFELVRQRNVLLRGVIETTFAQKTTFYATRKHVVPEEVVTVVSKMSSGRSSGLGILFEPFIRALIELLQYLAGLPDYWRTCLAAGVPLPPDWGSPEWQFIGVLDDEFISQGPEARIYAYESTTHPEGTCLALPRVGANDIATYFGVICLGTNTENACFWDNEVGVQRLPKNVNDSFSFEEFEGGSAINEPSGGICTDCHAGENPFVIHPESPAFQLAGFDIRADWYAPVGMNPAWPQNPGPGTMLDNVDTSFNPLFRPAQDGRSCLECHKLPDVSALTFYCNSVLKPSARNTMPLESDPAGWSSPNSSDFRRHIRALRQACP